MGNSDQNKKLEKLKKILQDMESVVVAFSGGVDSAFLLKVAHDVLGDKAMAAIGQSPSFAGREFEESKKVAQTIGSSFIVVETNELDDKNYASNPSNRCYYCKSELLTKLKAHAQKLGFKHVVEGSNADDASDYRPGIKAVCDQDVSSPLMDAGLTKHEIRSFSKEMGLPTWDKPSSPCLSSRFPYGTAITKDNLKMVEQAEQFLYDLGLKQFRVRYHNDVARIEVLKKDMKFILENGNAEKIVDRFREIGFNYVALDLKGYRMGSLNEVLKSK